MVVSRAARNPTSFYLTDAAKNALTEIAERHDRSKTWIVDRLIRAELTACRLGRGPEESSGKGAGVRLGQKATPLAILGAVWDQHHGNLPPRELSRKKGYAQLARDRMAECPDIGLWREVVEKLAASAFCNGRNQRGWRANFPFLLLPGTRADVLNGRFDDEKLNRPPKTPPPPAAPPPAEGVRYRTVGEGLEAGKTADRLGVDTQEAGSTIGLPEGEKSSAVEGEVHSEAPESIGGPVTAENSPPTAENSPLPAEGAENSPPPVAASPQVRSYEDPDAPPWILELVDRIANEEAQPMEVELYRRWARGEEVGPAESVETSP